VTNKPHDAFFNVLFHNPTTAADLFREHLPADLQRDIDWSTLIT